MKINFRAATLSFLAIALALAGGSLMLPNGAAAQSAASTDVALTKVLLTMPGQGFFTNDDVPLVGARWLDGGYFVVNSFCSGKSGSNRKGLWAFTTTGAVAGTRDTCLDIGEGANDSVAHAWGVSPNVQPVGPATFVKEMSGSNGRPPVLYSISGNQVNYLSQAFTSPLKSSNWNGSDSTSNIAAIPGYAVAYQNFGSSAPALVLYSLPNWTVLQTIRAPFIPITGVGNYIVGTPIPGNRDLVLYRVSNGKLEKVGDTIRTNIRPVEAAVDTASQGTRVGFLFQNDGGSGKNHLAVYNVGSSGLSLQRDVTLPSKTSVAGTAYQGSIALSGDRVAFVDCGLPAMAPPPGGGRDFFTAATCGLGVIQGSTRLNVQRLPYATTIGAVANGTPVQIYPPTLNGVAMSPDGTILATSYYGAYLYKIGGIPGSFDPQNPPSNNGSTTLAQVPGQTFNITYSTSTPAAPPAVLIRFANVLSVAATSLNITIFGREYTVDASAAQIVNNGWRPTSLAEFATAPFANVWGTLDLANSSLIHALRVRNPLPAIAVQPPADPAKALDPTTVNFTSAAPVTTNAATQVQLNALQQALQALQLRLAQ